MRGDTDLKYPREESFDRMPSGSSRRAGESSLYPRLSRPIRRDTNRRSAEGDLGAVVLFTICVPSFIARFVGSA